MTNAEITAKILLETQSVLLQPDNPFTLTSGRKSPVYVDCRRLIAFPRARRMLIDMAVEHLEKTVGFDSIQAVAGGETAGIPYAAWISEKMSLPMAYIRKKPKGFGRNARIEGHIQEGQHVLLVEDLATDGGSKISFVEAIREAGAWCEHCFVIFHYGIFMDGIAALEKQGVNLHALATWRDVIDMAKSLNMLDTAAIDSLENFLQNPNDWA
jgi:orotate phosphoribosyltransferase